MANGEGVLVGPDNGLLAPAVAMAGGAERAVLLTNPEFQLASPGALFAVRDVLAGRTPAPRPTLLPCTLSPSPVTPSWVSSWLTAVTSRME